MCSSSALENITCRYRYQASWGWQGLYAEILQSLPYFKKKGAQLQAVSGGTLEDNVVSHNT